MQTGRNKGNLGYQLENWQIAIEGYEKAISAVEQSREWATSQQGKRETIEQALDVYENMVLACIKANKLDKAIETVERSKSRYLVELLAATDIEPQNASEEQKQQLKDLRNSIAITSRVLEGKQADTDSDKPNQTQTRGNTEDLHSSNTNQQQRQKLHQYQQKLNQLLDEIKQVDPEFTLTQRVEPIDLQQIQTLLDNQTAILEWYIGINSFQAFIITNNSIYPVEFSPSEFIDLKSWANEYLEDYGKDNWENVIEDRLNRLSTILRLSDVVAKIPTRCQKLILIPHSFLHLFPLHALLVQPRPGEGEMETEESKTSLTVRYLQEEFSRGVRYAPSCHLLHRLYQRQTQREGEKQNDSTLFAIQNPTKDLNYADLEVDTIKNYFDPHMYILPREEATRDNFYKPTSLEELRRAYYVHFSCHGACNLKYPLSSALTLAGSITAAPTSEVDEVDEKEYVTLRDGRKANTGESLTLEEILTRLKLPQCYLVTLSACETGLNASMTITDEYITLASGFLYAGSPSVVNSLWRVDDFATAWLMIRFYQLLLDEDNNLSISQALKEAQKWLREVSKEDLINWWHTLELSEENIEILSLWLRLPRYNNDPPFCHPKYWAAFCSVGI